MCSALFWCRVRSYSVSRDNIGQKIKKQQWEQVFGLSILKRGGLYESRYEDTIRLILR